MNWKSPERWAGIVLVLAALALYLWTLDNGLRPEELMGGDLITHQYAQVQGRPSNAPGYPLYTMGGWLWFHGWRSILAAEANPTAILSTYSTLWALLALWLLYRLILHETGNWLVGLLLGAFYAVTYFFWYYATSTEQYTSAVALTLAIVLVAYHWEDTLDRSQPGRSEKEEARADRYILLLAFLSGVILAHMVTVAFIIPPLLWFILSRQPGLLRRPRLILTSIAAALLPLLSYFFVYIRGAQHPEWRGEGQWPNAGAWFWDFVSTQQGQDELTWSLTPLWTHEFPSMIWQELTWIILFGGLAGLFLMNRRHGLFLGATLAIYLAFSFIDRLGNWFQVIMPAYALLVLSFAVAVQCLWTRLKDASPKSRLSTAMLRGLQIALVSGLLLLLVFRFDASWSRANQRNRARDTALAAGQAILADDPQPNAAILADFAETVSLRYLRDIWNLRPDLQAVGSKDAGDILATGDRPLYVTRTAAPLVWQEVSPSAHFSSAGNTLIALSKEPAPALPGDVRPLSLPAGPALSLAGIETQLGNPIEDGHQSLSVRLFWQARAPVAEDWRVSVRPTGSGHPITTPDGSPLQMDLLHPVHGTYPMSRWLPGEVVADDYLIPIPPGQQVDGIQVFVYRPLEDGTFENLTVLEIPLK
ncbi:MAG: DUF2723 domain-containing protein [Chloroflexota bacterium]|nr:DUF2723 domain-containing protein [Chloroflexota bacterium]